MAIMRAIPNMTVLAPADGIETKKIIEASVEYNGPVYIRVNRNEVPDVTSEGEKFIIGKPGVIRDGNDIVVFANGYMVWKALQAAESLEREGISVRVVNVSSLKPVDEELIKEMASGVKGIITIEEHTIIGGLASIITFILRGGGIPIEPIAINDVFGTSTMDYEQLLDHFGLSESSVIQAARKILS